jgi:NAD(P)-dependent dehydrogenase (short-subunit alcohol dehydrogenase family)
MSRDNPLWGAPRIHGELLKLGIGAQGCRVAICARDSGELSRALADLRERGAEAAAFTCDVRDEADVESLIERVESTFGSIDILVNNAAIIQVGPVTSMEKRDFVEAMDTIFWGMVNCTLATLNGMRGRGAGLIVNIASVGGKVGIPHLVPYSAAKFALTGFSEALASEVGRDGVKVLTVIPGLMRTGSHLNAQFKGDSAHEFGWFSFAASSPLLAMHVKTASRRIVKAIRSGESHVTLGMPAYLLSRAHGIAPGAVLSVLGVADRLLPKNSQKAAVDGFTARDRLNSGLNRVATKLGSGAAEDLNQIAVGAPL